VDYEASIQDPNQFTQIPSSQDDNNLIAEVSESLEKKNEPKYHCMQTGCATIFDSNDIKASVQQRLCALHYADLQAHIDFVERMNKSNVPDIDLDLPVDIDPVEDIRNSHDTEPCEPQSVSMQNEKCHLFQVNKSYDGPKSATELGRVLRDIHLHDKMYAII